MARAKECRQIDVSAIKSRWNKSGFAWKYQKTSVKTRRFRSAGIEK